jgi:hypothetical protein
LPVHPRFCFYSRIDVFYFTHSFVLYSYLDTFQLTSGEEDDWGALENVAASVTDPTVTASFTSPTNTQPKQQDGRGSGGAGNQAENNLKKKADRAIKLMTLHASKVNGVIPILQSVEYMISIMSILMYVCSNIYYSATL